MYHTHTFCFDLDVRLNEVCWMKFVILSYFTAKLPEFTKERKDEIWKEFRKIIKRAEKPKNILVIGEQGVGKSSFINSNMTCITGKYKDKAEAGMQGDTSNVTVRLKR